jgi:hypothetical protein
MVFSKGLICSRNEGLQGIRKPAIKPRQGLDIEELFLFMMLTLTWQYCFHIFVCVRGNIVKMVCLYVILLNNVVYCTALTDVNVCSLLQCVFSIRHWKTSIIMAITMPEMSIYCLLLR